VIAPRLLGFISLLRRVCCCDAFHPSRRFRTIGIILDDYDLSILVLIGEIAEFPAVRGLGSMNIKRSSLDSTSIAI
jgi:hypothetical protein